MATAQAHLAASLACSRALGEPALAAWALRDLGQWHIQAGAFGPARRLLREGLMLARAAGDRRGVAAALMIQAQVAALGGDPRRARVLNQASLAGARQVRDRWLVCAVLPQLGSLAVDQGDFETAVPLLEEGLGMCRSLRWHERAGRARVAHARGERAEATALLREALRLRQALGDPLGSLECLETLAAVDAGVEPRRAAWLLGAAAAARRALGAPPAPLPQRALAATARTVRAVAGAAAFRAAKAAGERVSLEQAIVQALAERPAARTAAEPRRRTGPAGKQG